VLACVCDQLDLRGLIRAAETCKRFRHGEGGLETVELPTSSPVNAGLRALGFPGRGLIPSTRPIGCSESWVAYLSRCARQRRCREAPLISMQVQHNVFLASACQLLSCGRGTTVRQGDVDVEYPFPPFPTSVGDVGTRMRSVAAGPVHGLALGWNGRVYSWGSNCFGQLGHGDRIDRPSPVLVEGLESVRGVAASGGLSFAVTQSGQVFQWGDTFRPGAEGTLRPVLLEGFGGVRVHRICCGDGVAFAIGEDGELFSWGQGENWLLGHGNTQDQPSPKRVEALRGVRIAVSRLEDIMRSRWPRTDWCTRGVRIMAGLTWATRMWRGSCCRSRSRRSGACV
jgi:hypothetical protein